MANTYLDFISGERFQTIADIYLGTQERFNCNPYIATQYSKQLDIRTINNPFNNPKTIFCYSNMLNDLYSKLQYFTNPFVLISHNSDENIDERYEKLLYSNKIIRWYSQNIQIIHPKLSLLPIGIANGMWEHGNLNTLETTINRKIPKSNDFYFYFNISTNYNKRTHCKVEIEKKGLVFGTQVNFDSYLQDLATYKFAICPPGNGIDSHRIWECYYLGVIPIMLKSTFTEHIKNRLPCILLDNWSDFNQVEILSKYDILINQLYLNNKYLKFNYYYDEINAINQK